MALPADGCSVVPLHASWPSTQVTLQSLLPHLSLKLVGESRPPLLSGFQRRYPVASNWGLLPQSPCCLSGLLPTSFIPQKVTADCLTLFLRSPFLLQTSWLRNHHPAPTHLGSDWWSDFSKKGDVNSLLKFLILIWYSPLIHTIFHEWHWPAFSKSQTYRKQSIMMAKSFLMNHWKAKSSSVYVISIDKISLHFALIWNEHG